MPSSSHAAAVIRMSMQLDFNKGDKRNEIFAYKHSKASAREMQTVLQRLQAQRRELLTHGVGVEPLGEPNPLAQVHAPTAVPAWQDDGSTDATVFLTEDSGGEVAEASPKRVPRGDAVDVEELRRRREQRKAAMERLLRGIAAGAHSPRHSAAAATGGGASPPRASCPQVVSPLEFVV